MASKNQEKTRILVLSTGYLPLIGGSELAIQNVTERMPGYEFDLVTGQYDTSALAVEQVGRAKVFRVGGWVHSLSFGLPKLFVTLAIFFKAWRLTYQYQYAAVHAWQASQAAGAAWLLSFVRPSIPLLVTLQEGKDLDKQPALIRFSRKLILKRARTITAISMYLCKYAQRMTTTPCILVPNGVDVGKFANSSQARTQTLRRELGLDDNGKILVSASRLVKKNNIASLIRALANMEHSSASLLLVGDGNLRSKLEQLAMDLGVADRVVFVGTVRHEELPAYLALGNVFVRPSLSEGLGTAFLEAMAVGLPVVASPVGGIPDIVHDGLNGLLCDPEDVPAIARCLDKVLSDDALADRFSKNARQVADDYDWRRIAERMERVYRGLTQTNS
jgi:glycosyltransferase involved in cell wall biosynthesis